MSGNDIPVPGEVLRTNIFLGLSFMEIITLCTIPMLLMAPAVFIKEIPLAFIAVALVIGLAIIVFLLLRTPEGQKPLQWAPRYIKRRFGPSTYYLKPRQASREKAIIKDRVLTAKQIRAESDGDASADKILAEADRLLDSSRPTEATDCSADEPPSN